MKRSCPECKSKSTIKGYNIRGARVGVCNLCSHEGPLKDFMPKKKKKPKKHSQSIYENQMNAQALISHARQAFKPWAIKTANEHLLQDIARTVALNKKNQVVLIMTKNGPVFCEFKVIKEPLKADKIYVMDENCR